MKQNDADGKPQKNKWSENCRFRFGCFRTFFFLFQIECRSANKEPLHFVRWSSSFCLDWLQKKKFMKKNETSIKSIRDCSTSTGRPFEFDLDENRRKKVIFVIVSFVIVVDRLPLRQCQWSLMRRSWYKKFVGFAEPHDAMSSVSISIYLKCTKMDVCICRPLKSS